MRMIGIGLMGFLLAGVALLLSTMDILEKGQRYVSEMTQGPQLVFEERTAVPASDAHMAVVKRANPNNPVILSGLPAYQSVAFKIPLDARPTSGYLQIDATFQVLDGVEGVLRISIDNTRRGEMLLRPGEVGRSLQIPLSPTDFARDQLVVSFSLQGEGPRSQCSSDEGLEAVVEIETTSAVFLTLDLPLVSTPDRIHAWGDMVRVAWPAWLKPDEQLRRLALAARFQQRGIQPVFVGGQADDALSTDQMREGLSFFALATDSKDRGVFTETLATTGANAGVRSFHRKTIWRERFDLRATDAMHYAAAVDLDLRLGRLRAPEHWSLIVTLNNRLVYQADIDGAETAFLANIALPADMQSAKNLLEVALSATHTRDGICDTGPELVAELLPESRLIAGNTAYGDSLTDLRAALSDIGPLQLGATSALTAAEAQTAAALLSQIAPENVVLKPSNALAQIVVIAAQDIPLSLPQADNMWLVSMEAGTLEVSVQDLRGHSTVPRTGGAILVIPTGLDLSEVST